MIFFIRLKSLGNTPKVFFRLFRNELLIKTKTEMIKNEIVKEELFNSEMRKVVIGLRCHAELKLVLSQEAMDLGIPLSEYCESALHNRHDFKKGHGVLVKAVERLKGAYQDIERLREKIREIEKLREQESKLNSQLVESTSRHKVKLEELEKENMMLKKAASDTSSLMSLLNDPHLLSLYEEVKGKKVTIPPDGRANFPVLFDSFYNFLKVVLRSFRLKK